MSSRLRFAVVAMCACVSTLSANATLVFESRTNTRTIDFSGQTFGGATDTFLTTLNATGNLGDSATYTNIVVPATTTGFYWASGSGVALSNTALGNLGAPAAFTATLIAPTNQTVNYGGVATRPVDIVSGQYQLAFHNPGGGGFVRPGGTYVFEMFLLGDWSHLGTGTGQTEYLGVGAGYNVTDFFVYDAATNRTLIRAVNSNYDGSSTPGLDFVLHGASVVPLPAAGWLLISGLGGLGAIVRRRKAA